MGDYGGGDGGDEDRLYEWEAGLPTLSDLMPLSQPLLPPELASAFSISAEPYQTMADVNRASNNTLSGLLAQSSSFADPIVVDQDEQQPNRDRDDGDGSHGTESRKLRRVDSGEETDSAAAPRPSSAAVSAANSSLKRPRLVWTPQLHKRFVEVVALLGIKNAVPKTIMQMMNVEGLTRENVASHLQKYRLYLKRMQGMSNEGPSTSDQLLFGSSPVQQESGGSGHVPPHPNSATYGPPMMMHMPVMGHMGMGLPNYRGFESNPYNMMQQRDWPGNRLGMSYPQHHVTPNEK